MAFCDEALSEYGGDVRDGVMGVIALGQLKERHVRVFAESRDVAEHLRDVLKQGKEITLKDFEPRP